MPGARKGHKMAAENKVGFLFSLKSAQKKKRKLCH